MTYKKGDLVKPVGSTIFGIPHCPEGTNSRGVVVEVREPTDGYYPNSALEKIKAAPLALGIETLMVRVRWAVTGSGDNPMSSWYYEDEVEPV